MFWKVIKQGPRQLHVRTHVLTLKWRESDNKPKGRKREGEVQGVRAEEKGRAGRWFRPWNLGRGIIEDGGIVNGCGGREVMFQVGSAGFGGSQAETGRSVHARAMLPSQGQKHLQGSVKTQIMTQ